LLQDLCRAAWRLLAYIPNTAFFWKNVSWNVVLFVNPPGSRTRGPYWQQKDPLEHPLTLFRKDNIQYTVRGNLFRSSHVSLFHRAESSPPAGLICGSKSSAWGFGKQYVTVRHCWVRSGRSGFNLMEKKTENLNVRNRSKRSDQSMITQKTNERTLPCCTTHSSVVAKPAVLACFSCSTSGDCCSSNDSGGHIDRPT
jgi:hypothetical protein